MEFLVFFFENKNWKLIGEQERESDVKGKYVPWDHLLSSLSNHGDANRFFIPSYHSC